MPQRFAWTHIGLPIAIYTAVIALLLAADGDRWLSHTLFYRGSAGPWLGAGAGSWWARDILHTGGAAAMRLIAIVALLVWCLTFLQRVPWGNRRSAIRGGAGFVAIAMILSVTLVGALKTITDVACPWDLAEFGGTRPYVELLAQRPANFSHARCFPGSHSASGFALLSFYFVLQPYSRKFARLALVAGLTVGGLFAFGQEARGAHFLSHDLTSAMLVWLVLCGLYVASLRKPVREGSRVPHSYGVAVLAGLLVCAPVESRILPRLDARAPKVSLERPPGVPSDVELEAAEARIGVVSIVLNDVFDTSNPEENTSLGRLANRLHIETRESTIRDQLLFASGERYVGRLLEESARLLRETRYMRDTIVRPIAYRDGVVDVEVVSRDVWTLNPGASFGRKGGMSTTGFELEELNLLGLGVEISLDVKSGVDRDTKSIQFADRQLGSSWWGLEALYADNSDGRLMSAQIAHPFYALDARWAAAISAYDDERITSRYDLGLIVDQYRARRRATNAYWGWSAGLRDGWVTRYTLGLTFDDQKFEPLELPNSPTRLVPAARKLVYPSFAVEWVQDDFRTERNRDQIEKIEDFALGWRAFLQLGLASEGAGSDRDAGIFNAGVSKGFDNGARQTLLLNAYTTGRVESGETAGAFTGGAARYYFRQSPRRTFYLSVSADFANNLDADRQLTLGGDNGLRGYPLRYQAGTSRWLMTAEQRFYTSWYPFRLFNVGGAIFYDMGRTTGRDPLGSPSLGLLRDIGFGLRFGNARSGLGNVLHVDFAVPLDGDSSIDDVQVLVETKRSY